MLREILSHDHLHGRASPEAAKAPGALGALSAAGTAGRAPAATLLGDYLAEVDCEYEAWRGALAAALDIGASTLPVSRQQGVGPAASMVRPRPANLQS